MYKIKGNDKITETICISQKERPFKKGQYPGKIRQSANHHNCPDMVRLGLSFT